MPLNSICPKEDKIARLDFEFTYNNVAVKQVNHSTTGSPLPKGRKEGRKEGRKVRGQKIKKKINKIRLIS